MRSYCAIYVDAGYLLASAATRVTGTSLRRGVHVDHAKLVSGLIEQAEQDSGMPLLRVNWYDSGGRPGGMPDVHQEDIGLLPRVKLRLGRLSHAGEQKGVDLRMGLDLATYGRNRVVDVIYLVSGDDDLTEAVEEAQFHGLQVVLMAVPDQRRRPYAVARNLQREADGVILLDGEVIDAAVKPVKIPAALVPGTETEPAEELVAQAAAAIDGAPATDGPEPAATPGPPAPAAPARTQTPSPAELAGVNGARSADTADDVDTGHPAPTPAVLAGKRPTSIVAPKGPTAPPVMWSTTTGEATRFDEGDGITDTLIDAVVRQVVTSWVTSASPEALIEVRRGEPYIPGDLDRTLLLDLSSRSGVYDIDDASRHALRDRFWAVIRQLKLS